MKPAWLLLCTELGVCLALPARAQSSAAGVPGPERAQTDTEPTAALGIKARSSTDQVRAWLGSDDPALREKALKRLAIRSDAQGLELLLKAVQPDGQARTPRLRLTALRSLAHFLEDAAVRRALVTIMSGAGQPPESANDPLETLVRETAAMALGASHKRDALTVLGKALRQGGPSGQAAARALVAYPPSDLKGLLTSPSAASTRLIEVLGNLGDQRAFNALRAYVTRGAPEVRALATVVLTELGHLETVALARHWLKTEKADPNQRLAALRVLGMVRAADAGEHFSAFIADDEHLDSAIELAFELPNPAFAKGLIRVFPSASADQKSFVAAALARAGGEHALAFLEKELKSGSLDAAHALAQSAEQAAEDALVAGLGVQKTRRSCARALVLRAVATGSEAPELRASLRELVKERDAGDRAAGAFGLSALDDSSALELLNSKDRVSVIAAARSAYRGARARAAAQRLAAETDPMLRLALSNALNDSAARALIPRAVLDALIESGSAAASLAARALGARFVASDQGIGGHLLESPNPQLRAEFALGLGFSEDPQAAGRLLRAYEFETDPSVRRAIVSALSQRPETVRRRVIEWARRLDPDPLVRHLAELAESGQRLLEQPEGHQTFWLMLSRNSDSNAALELPVVVQGTRGHTLVGLPDPDGFVGFSGMDAGPLRYLLGEAAN